MSSWCLHKKIQGTQHVLFENAQPHPPLGGQHPADHSRKHLNEFTSYDRAR